jgi:5-methylcytosine-specific restriction endonuclease McrA
MINISMGRKKLYHTDEETKAAKRRYNEKYYAKEGKKEMQYRSNQTTQSERFKRWQQNNREKVRLKNANERAARLQRLPLWANKEAIKEFYLSCPEGYHVDHIIPLRGNNVSGLHIIENLQYLPAKENMSKGNRYTA